jgi:hypothetical protein
VSSKWPSITRKRAWPSSSKSYSETTARVRVNSGVGSSWYELVAEGGGGSGQAVYAGGVITALVCCSSFINERLSPAQQAIDSSSQLSGGGECGDIGSQAACQLTEVGSQGRLAVPQREGGIAQGRCYPAAGATRLLLFQRLASTHGFSGRERGMRGEFFLGRKAWRKGSSPAAGSSWLCWRSSA